ncbi:MAG: DMT family transporter [Clostridia bacterium]|nr:DMT family transporter [Clostridia bacterium]
MNEQNRYTPVGSLILAAVSMIWGFSFAVQKTASRALLPFSVNTVRFFIGALTLFLFSFFRNLIRRRRDPAYRPAPFTRTDLVAGGISGTLLFVASTFQQFSLNEGDAGICAAITTLYIVFVPLFGAILFRKRIRVSVIVAGVIALAGTFSLSVLGELPGADEVRSVSALVSLARSAEFSVGRPALFALLCSVGFALQILSIDRFAKEVDGIRLATMEFLISGVLGVPFLLFRERPTPSAVLAALPPLLYLGILSCGVAYTLQIVGQAKTPPAVAAVVMSLEAVFGALGGILFLGERMNAPEILGCALIMTAVFTVELSALGRGKRNRIKDP